MYQTGTTPANTASMLMGGCYEIPAIAVDTRGMRTHKVPASPSRGAGRPEAALLTEGIVQDAARQLGIDAAELRRRNFVREFPYRTPLGFEYDSGDFEACLDRALELLGPKPAAPEGKLVGLGLGCYVERAGGQHEVARVSVEEGGRIVVSSGSQPLGTGLATTFAQIAADELDVPIDRIELRFGEAGGVGTFASRSTAMGGSAVKLACAELREQGLVEGASVTHASSRRRLLVGLLRRDRRDRPGDRRARDPARRRRRRPGHADQPAARRGTGLRRHRPRPRRVPHRGGDLGRVGNPQSTSFAGYHLLTAADVPPIVPALLRDAVAVEPARREGNRRGRLDRRPARGRERGRRRPRQAARPAVHAAEALGGAP